MSLLQYEEKNTFFDRLDPRTKIVWPIFVMALSLATSNLLYLLIITGMVFAIAVAAQRMKALANKTYLKMFAFLLVFLVTIQGVFYWSHLTAMTPVLYFPESIPYVGGWRIFTKEGLLFGLSMFSRMVIILVSFALFAKAMSEKDIIIALTSMKLPYPLAFTFAIAVGYTTAIQDSLDRIILAQKSRAFGGFEGSLKQKIRAFLPLLLPLVFTAFETAENLTLALECRAFGLKKKRTYLRELKLSKTDAAFGASQVAFTIAFLYIIWYSPFSI